MVTLSGDNITAPGQVTVGLPPSSPNHVVRHSDRRLRFCLSASIAGVDANGAVPYDGPIIPISTPDISVTRYIVEKILVLNPSADHSAAVLALYTQAGGTGVEVMPPVILASLTGPDKVQEILIAANTVLTAAELYPRFTGASGNAGTVDIIVFLLDLTVV